MEVHLAPEIEERLNQFAAAQGKSAEEIIEETIVRMLQGQTHSIEGADQLPDANFGDLLDQAELVERTDRLLRS